MGCEQYQHNIPEQSQEFVSLEGGNETNGLDQKGVYKSYPYSVPPKPKIEIIMFPISLTPKVIWRSICKSNEICSMQGSS